MRKELLILIFALLACNLPKIYSQEYHINENFSTPEWETELNRLNPGQDEFQVPINPNAPNVNPYTTPVIPEGKPNGAYTNLNSTDLYFNKYLLFGAIEVLPTMPCADESSHVAEGVDVGFRLTNNANGRIELPEVPNAGKLTIHIRNGNDKNPTQVALEKLIDSEANTWEQIHVFDLQNHTAYPDFRDEVLSFDVNSDVPIKLRLINNVAATKRFMNLFEIKVEKKAQTSINNVPANTFQLAGRKLTTEKPEKIQIYSMVGMKLFEQFVVNEIEIPQTINKGIYLLKSGNQSQKIYLD